MTTHKADTGSKNDARVRMRREDRRRAILRAAIGVFGRYGAQHATTQQLARAAGVSEALLYQHFASKQALLIAAIEELGRRLYAGLRELLAEQPDDPGALFLTLTSQLQALLREVPDVGRFSLVIQAELEDEAVRSAVRGVVVQVVDLLERALRQGQARGVLDTAQDARLLAWAIVGMYHHFALLGRLELLDGFEQERLVQLVQPFLGRAPAGEHL